MAAETQGPQFEGWLGKDADSVHGKMEWVCSALVLTNSTKLLYTDNQTGPFHPQEVD